FLATNMQAQQPNFGHGGQRPHGFGSPLGVGHHAADHLTSIPEGGGDPVPMDIDDVQCRGTNMAGESRDSAVEPSYWTEAVQEARQADLEVLDGQTDRIDALRSRIRTGDLVPDPDRIAKALLGQGVVDA